jgi:uncharacterized membrane protein YraQ (UPF0718 family)
MSWTKELRKLGLILAVFAACFFLPAGYPRFDSAVGEALHLLRWYAREHVLLCLVPAFFIAGGIAVFVSQASVMKYLGAGANKVLAYGVASVSGTILAVCSCTVLPLFAGIYRMGAGLGPATAFLYSGPAINVLAIILTARILGVELGIARAVGAIVFSVVIGLLMHLICGEGRREASRPQAAMPAGGPSRPLWQNAVFFAAMVAVLVFANWGRPSDVRVEFRAGGGEGELHADGMLLAETDQAIRLRRDDGTVAEIDKAFVARVYPLGGAGAYTLIYNSRFYIAGAFLVLLLGLLPIWFGRAELGEWVGSTWGFAKQILPLLLLGVLVAGFLLGRPHHEGLIPSGWVARAVGGNSLRANLAASVAGAFMYFATLTEVPILQGLLGAGMGKGPALALLLAGPALSLPNMLVIRSVIGTRRTVVYVLLVISMATVSGMIFGALRS